MDAFGSKTAVGFGTLPEVVESSALDSVHEASSVSGEVLPDLEFLQPPRKRRKKRGKRY